MYLYRIFTFLDNKNPIRGDKWTDGQNIILAWSIMEGHDASTCIGCIEMTQNDKLLASMTGMSDNDFNKMFRKIYDKWYRTCPCFVKSKSHKGNGAPNGLFAGTLTMSPEWGKTEDDIVRAAEKIFAQKTCPVKRYAWYLELTENGTPHIHFIYETETGGRIHQKVFKRYWEWDESIKVGKGHKGGYHKPVLSETAYTEYLSKEEGRHAMSGFEIE